MAEPDSFGVVRSFLEQINAHNIPGLVALMTDDHLFVDSLGAIVRGREEMRKAWIGYFYMIPDYTIIYSTILVQEATVGVFGRARGTCSFGSRLLPQNSWEIPFAAMAVLRGDRISEWHVFADNEPIRQIMAGSTATDDASTRPRRSDPTRG
jgi:ketosteroid isomerase-like protein